MNPLNNLPPIAKNLLIINIIFFVGSAIFSGSSEFFGVFYPDSPLFKVWQPITYMFMHGSLMHIFFNMFALVMFGSIIEQVLGNKRFLNYYLICGLGALVLQYGVQAIEVYQITGTISARDWLEIDMYSGRTYATRPIDRDSLEVLASIYRTPMVGASGAVFGLLLAFAYLYPNMPLQFLFIPVPIKAKYFVGGYILIEIYLGFAHTTSSIAHLAHVGGALFGFILLKTWGIRRTNFY
ncbi:rhomboid family intramembrane serine protease [Sphingobacterium corticibacter]|uniref:Rhomboid family intramembrane serine protease n=1 Tax=Sphingobacterium corticibacter TaxID=2171749 RepID=A0A2T8HJA7_9SPHI|nr:rhomboid family intramembrane serine protease [Sphingobacterium corticibacter]PVH25536.1 rhomboid family intramembrane serine protease [Sphingobacterium corticibacter]